tara:strand:+ start:141 stop:2024 length:1884 start_codon:yes stop_codon:yes gene_type:complete
MASGTKVDELIIQIKADTKQLKKELKQIEGKIRTTGAVGGAAFGALGGASGALASSLKALAGPAAIGAVLIGVGKLGSFAARSGMEFEDLKDSLDTVFGSVQAGDKQFQRILTFAQTTPFQIDTVTKAFISLGSVGIEPTTRMMQVFADTASVAVDQRGAFEALIRVVQRAEAGALGLQELNMLADRGIDVFKGLKEELGLSRLELSDFGQTADGAKIIVEALTDVLEKQFGGAMASKMDNLSVKISNMQIAFKDLGNEIFKTNLEGILKGITDEVSELVSGFARLIRLREGRATLEDLKKEAESLQRQLDRTTNAINLFGVDVDPEDRGFIEKLLFGNKSPEQLRNIIKEIEDEITIRTDEEDTKEDADVQNLLIQGKMANVMGLVQKHQEKLQGSTALLTFAQQNANEIFEKYKELLDEIGIESVPQLKKVLDDLTVVTDENARTFTEVLAPAIQSMSLSFTNDFVNALLEGENALQSFQDFSKNIVSQIISTFMQMAVINEILVSIFGKSGFNIEGFSLPTLSGRKAGGGTVQKGVPTLVGERGAEIFVPNTGGTVMNNMNTKNALGGGNPIIVNQSINFATGVVPTVRAEVMQMMPQIADVTKAAVQESAMRGGTFRRSLQGG